MADYAKRRSQLKITWPRASRKSGDSLPIENREPALTEITTESLTVNIIKDAKGGRYTLSQGGTRTDLKALETPLTITPDPERALYSLKIGETISTFSNFSDFVVELQVQINTGLKVTGLHAQGGYDTKTSTFKAAKISLKLN